MNRVKSRARKDYRGNNETEEINLIELLDVSTLGQRATHALTHFKINKKRSAKRKTKSGKPKTNYPVIVNVQEIPYKNTEQHGIEKQKETQRYEIEKINSTEIATTEDSKHAENGLTKFFKETIVGLSSDLSLLFDILLY